MRHKARGDVWLSILSLTAAPMALASPLSDAIEPALKSYSESSRAQQSILQLRSGSTLIQGALSDSPLSVSLTAGRIAGGQLSTNDLLLSSGQNAFQTDAIQTKLAVTPRNFGLLNSLELDLSYSLNLFQYQIYQGSGLNPPGMAQTWEAKLSYDLIQRGSTDTIQLGNEIQKYQLSSSYYSNAKALVNDYLSYRDLLLDLMAAWCKLQNSVQDLKIITEVVHQVKTAYEVRSTAYKQLLNVIDTKNSIYRNKLNYELQLEGFKKALLAYGDKRAESVARTIIDHAQCAVTPAFLDRYDEQYSVLDHSAFAFEKSLDFQVARFELDAKQTQVSYDRNSELPTVRPYIGVTQTNQLGFQYQQLEGGLAINWNAPGEKQISVVSSDRILVKSGEKSVESLRDQFASTDATLTDNIEKNREILKSSREAYTNSDTLIKLLEVQRSIGQMDSLSIANAFSQRNQILNSMYDSLVSIEKDYLHWRALIDWKPLLEQAGVKIK